MEGQETEAVVDLACVEDMHWQKRERLLTEVLEWLGYSMPLTKLDLCRTIQERLLERYQDGEIDEIELVRQGYVLWLKSDYDPNFRIWGDLDEDISMCDSEYGPIFYPIDPANIRASVKAS